MTVLSMQIPENIKSLSASDIGQLLHKKKVCPIDLVNFYFDEIESFSKPSPYIYLTKDRAYKEARLSKKRILEDKPLSPLDGVPVAWKDLFDFKDYITTSGSKIFDKSKPAKQDAYAVNLAKKAGLIQLGKTSTVEFALGGIGTNNNFITPENAIMTNEPHVPGGSSSGSGVALANGLCAASFGTDTGGSVRIPSAWNKLVGLKTSIGRISLKGVTPLASSYDTVGPLTKSIKDASLLFSILTKSHYADFKKIDSKKIRLLVVRGMPWLNANIKVQKACEEAINSLSKSGINIIEKKVYEIEEMHNLLLENNGGTTVAEAYSEWKSIVEKHSSLMDKDVLNRMLIGKNITQQSLNIIYQAEEKLSKKLHFSMHEYDAILMPTIPILPPTIAQVQKDMETYDKFNRLALRNTRIANSLRLCAITLPLPENVPIGIMLCKALGKDEELLNVANAIFDIIK
ncbi:MAG: Mandelamide hydrolase [Alphaproteobacteria bacterium MarineAlpha9_Bin3]|nr:MAG: Mandelamide hydrolase [Alphaproteobacteria bacterium MarineAlpha9_Bin3]|tara:strand:- start:3 stop:1376 length:1374 start_codon:yes stop_codon:yes gene_type:complete